MRPLSLRHRSRRRQLAPALRLALCTAALAACWLVLLPLVGQAPEVRDMIERNESLGIDPSAKFYSELPVIPEVLRRMRVHHRRAPTAFWRPGVRAK